MRASFAFASLLALSTVAGSALADPTAAEIDEGRARFGKGVTLFRAGDYRAALVEFNRANTVAPSFRIQFNIGQTCAELQEHGCAAHAFEVFLADGGKKVPPGERVIAERELKRLHALVGNVRIVVSAPGADVSVDDAPIGTSPLPDAVTVTAGKRKITAKRGSSAPVSTTVDVVAGETVDATLTLGEGGSSPDPTPTPDAAPPNRLPFWIGVGATGVLTVVTVTFGVLALGAKSDLDATVGRFGASQSDIDPARSKVDNLALATDIFGGAALIAAGVTTYFFLTTQPKKTQIGVGPRGISVRHAF